MRAYCLIGTTDFLVRRNPIWSTDLHCDRQYFHHNMQVLKTVLGNLLSTSQTRITASLKQIGASSNDAQAIDENILECSKSIWHKGLMQFV